MTGPADCGHAHCGAAHGTEEGETAERVSNQAERFHKQRRLQHLRAELARVEADRDAKQVRVTEGGRHLATTRRHLDTAGLTAAEWREKWGCARDRIQANGSRDEPFGNLTITVTPAGQVSLRLPKPLEHLANAKQGRYVLSGTAIHYTRRYGITAIAVEDLDFADARTAGRETLGRGQRGKRFRKTVAGIPTAVFRNRLAAQTAAAGIRLLAVNAAYTSVWGEQHWRKPYKNVTRHEAAATVIGRRAQGHKARRREGVTRTRPEDRVVRATNQTAPHSQQATTSSCHQPGMRGTKSRLPGQTSTRLLGRATVSPATAINGPPHQ